MRGKPRNPELKQKKKTSKSTPTNQPRTSQGQPECQEKKRARERRAKTFQNLQNYVFKQNSYENCLCWIFNKILPEFPPENLIAYRQFKSDDGTDAGGARGWPEPAAAWTGAWRNRKTLNPNQTRNTANWHTNKHKQCQKHGWGGGRRGKGRAKKVNRSRPLGGRGDDVLLESFHRMEEKKKQSNPEPEVGRKLRLPGRRNLPIEPAFSWFSPRRKPDRRDSPSCGRVLFFSNFTLILSSVFTRCFFVLSRPELLCFCFGCCVLFYVEREGCHTNTNTEEPASILTPLTHTHTHLCSSFPLEQPVCLLFHPQRTPPNFTRNFCTINAQNSHKC